jgi:membrane-bound serine protease (ClpP class)
MTSAELMGVLLLIIALLLFILEIKLSGFGLAGIGAIVALIVALILLSSSWASLPFLLVGGVMLAGLFIFFAFLAHRATKNRVVTGEAGMIGLEGRVETALLPEGKVSIRGEIWDAWSPVRLERGEAVRVTGIRGLRLEVMAVKLERILPPTSVVQTEQDKDLPSKLKE